MALRLHIIDKNVGVLYNDSYKSERLQRLLQIRAIFKTLINF